VKGAQTRGRHDSRVFGMGPCLRRKQKQEGVRNQKCFITKRKNELKQRKEEGEGLGKTKRTNVVRRCVKTENEKMEKWKKHLGSTLNLRKGNACSQMCSP